MYKKTITYTDYDGIERTEDFYFNLNEAEITEWNFSEPGGMAAVIDRIIKSSESTQLIPLWKKVVMMAYGEKSPDGRRFIKSKELSEAFIQTEAYNTMFIEFAQDADAAAEFINNIIPSKETIEKKLNKSGANLNVMPTV